MLGRSYIISVLSFGLVLKVLGQHPLFQVHPINDPYAGASFELVYEDPDRWIWIGANLGLFQYDGQRVFPFIKKDSKSEHLTAK